MLPLGRKGWETMRGTVSFMHCCRYHYVNIAGSTQSLKFLQVHDPRTKYCLNASSPQPHEAEYANLATELCLDKTEGLHGCLRRESLGAANLVVVDDEVGDVAAQQPQPLPVCLQLSGSCRDVEAQAGPQPHLLEGLQRLLAEVYCQPPSRALLLWQHRKRLLCIYLSSGCPVLATVYADAPGISHIPFGFYTL